MSRTILLPAAVSAVVSLVVVLLASPTPGSASGVPPAPGRSEPVGADLAGLEQRMELLSGRVAVLENEATAPLAAPDEPLAAVERRLAAAETALAALTGPTEEELAALEPDELALEARTWYARHDYARSARYWEELLARSIDDELRADALSGLATCLRPLKLHEREEEVWREYVRLKGEDTPEGLGGLFQVAWSRSCREDFPEAVRLMRHVAEAPASSITYRRWARFWSADYLVRGGDPEAARPILAGLVERYAGSEDQNERYCHDRARALLEQIDAR